MSPAYRVQGDDLNISSPYFPAGRCLNRFRSRFQEAGAGREGPQAASGDLWEASPGDRYHLLLQ